MKRAALSTICFILILGASAFAQTAAWDSTFRPGGYKARLDVFQKDTITKRDIVFLGNSITAGTDWAKLLGDRRAKNRGISGDITFGVLDRLDEIIGARPAKIFILIGINDVSRNIPDEVIIGNYRKMIERIRAGSPKTKIYFQTLLPVNNTFKARNHFNKDEHILAINTAIKNFKYRKLTIVDLYSNFTDADKKLRAELTKDGLHLIPEGYVVWKGVLQKYL